MFCLYLHINLMLKNRIDVLLFFGIRYFYRQININLFLIPLQSLLEIYKTIIVDTFFFIEWNLAQASNIISFYLFLNETETYIGYDTIEFYILICFFLLNYIALEILYFTIYTSCSFSFFVLVWKTFAKGGGENRLFLHTNKMWPA